MKMHQNNGKSAGFLRFLLPSGSLAIAGLFIVGLAYAETACPTGMVPYQGPAVTQMENSNGECADLCDAGVRAIVAENGTRIDLFKTASTTRKLATKYNDMVCYADMPSGSQAGTLNVDVDGTAYYVAPSKWQICPPKYTLSYDCGDADSGVPPENQVITYGHEFNVGAGNGSCYKAGYYISGWKIGTATYTNKTAAVWTWTEDKVATAVWAKRSYGIGYLCNNCEYPYVLRGANDQGANKGYLDVWTPPTPTWCKYPGNATFKGWDVYSVANKDLGTFVPAGESVTFEWLHNIVMRAVWEWDYATEPYTLSFDCGVDEYGYPYGQPESKTVYYNELFSPGIPDVGNGGCWRRGFYVSAWKIGGTNVSPHGATRWTWKANQTATAVWIAYSFALPYICNNGTTVNTRVLANYQVEFTPSVTACVAPEGKVLSGYKLYDAFGDYTGNFIAAGDAFVYPYEENGSLHAVWIDAE